MSSQACQYMHPIQVVQKLITFFYLIYYFMFASYHAYHYLASLH